MVWFAKGFSCALLTDYKVLVFGNRARHTAVNDLGPDCERRPRRDSQAAGLVAVPNAACPVIAAILIAH